MIFSRGREYQVDVYSIGWKSTIKKWKEKKVKKTKQKKNNFLYEMGWYFPLEGQKHK